MSANIITALALAGTTFIVTACMSHQENQLPPEGHYKSHSSKTDASGTTYTTKKSTDVEVDEYGHKKAVVKTKTTKDPKGFFNKETKHESERTVTETR